MFDGHAWPMCRRINDWSGLLYEERIQLHCDRSSTDGGRLPFQGLVIELGPSAQRHITSESYHFWYANGLALPHQGAPSWVKASLPVLLNAKAKANEHALTQLGLPAQIKAAHRYLCNQPLYT